MRRDPNLLRMLRDTTRQVVEDLQNQKILRPDLDAQAASLSLELRKLLVNGHKRVANDARSLSKAAKESSARHQQELVRMKKAAQQAAATILTKSRARPTRSRSKKVQSGPL